MSDVEDNVSALVEALVKQAAQSAAVNSPPEATYRLQLNARFTFTDAARIVPYLHELGISHCYASPYLKARTGSMHGYDITDHGQLNPEIGSVDDYAAWNYSLQDRGMSQILDVVPNHMAITGNENRWWNDVLEDGPASAFAEYFDIEWSASSRPELRGRVLVPILGEPYGKVLESGQLHLEYAAGELSIHYFEHRFPVAPGSYGMVLVEGLADLLQVLGADAPALLEYQSILTAVKNLPARTETDPARLAEHHREKEVIKRRLAVLAAGNAAVAACIDKAVAHFNGQAGDPRSFDALEMLLGEQAYRLAYWRVASDEINYRRFFDINELAALSMERPEVFSAAHALVMRLLQEGLVTGLRIDHPDGLYDPEQYLRRLQKEYLVARARVLFAQHPPAGNLSWEQLEGPLRARLSAALPAEGKPCHWPLYVVVEKILGSDENLSEEWPTYGTSGYDFLNALNGLFVEPRTGGPG